MSDQKAAKKVTFFDFPKPFPWARGHGKPSDELRGVVFGMHLAGVGVTEISEALQLSRQGVYGIIKTLNEKLAGKEKEVSPHRLSTTDEFVDERRQLVEEMMDEKDEDSNYKIRYASELRRRIRIEAPTFMCSLRTLQRDLNELGHTWRVRPLTQAMTEQHKQRRVDSVDNLLSYDHTKIIFSDESVLILQRSVNLLSCSSLPQKVCQNLLPLIVATTTHTCGAEATNPRLRDPKKDTRPRLWYGA
jgi:predicted DNA-binding protein YlxM (UPF0122 family)